MEYFTQLTEEQGKVLQLCNSWFNYDEKGLTNDDIDLIAYCDLSGLSSEFKALIRKCFNQFMEQYGKLWDDADDEYYPSGPFHEGYEVDGHVYITSYTGDAGNYWNDEGDRYTICRPW